MVEHKCIYAESYLFFYDPSGHWLQIPAQLQLPLKRPKQRPARQSLPVELPRVEQLIACEPQECVCGACGQEKVVIGYEMAEQLDVEPAKYFVRVTKREKRACPHCPEQGVACAPLPPRIIEKSLASDRLIIETIVNKYADYVPLYRQSAILERDSRVELSRATLCGWVMRVGGCWVRSVGRWPRNS